MVDPGTARIPFPFSGVILEDVPPEPTLFDKVLEGEGEFKSLEYGFCVASGTEEEPERRYLLIFQGKPYAAGIMAASDLIESTTIRGFFIHLARNPLVRLSFYQADPVLLKSILVIQGNKPETEGASEFIKIESLVVGLMEGRTDALVTLVQEGRYNIAFVKGGKAVKAYLSDEVLQNAGGMEWMDIFRRIQLDQIQGKEIRIRIFQDMSTEPAPDYLEGDPQYTNGIYRYYTRALPEVIVRDRTRTLKRVSVEGYPFIIGRGQDADLTLNDPGVSRKHAVLEEKNGRVVVRDLGSLNGIFVNDHFTREFTLQDGDQVTLGSYNLQVVLPRSPAEDVQLVSQADDATMAMDRNAKVRIACPKCGAAGTIEASRLYSKKKIRIKCPQCRHGFSPTGT
jgi:hypothetical protein